MVQTCPKCAYVRTDRDAGDAGACPACGLIFARYLEATARKAAQYEGRGGTPAAAISRGFPWVKLLVLIAVAAMALAAFQKWHNHARLSPSPGLAMAANRAGPVQLREFSELFDNNISLASLARAGQYTVVEVYLDQCTYCRELEAALIPFREKRSDVGLVRVHHSGRFQLDISGMSQQDAQRKVDQVNARMKSYHLCGTPHVEVYGPDRQPLGRDRCADRDGTVLLWNWIGKETGIAPRHPPGKLTGL